MAEAEILKAADWYEAKREGLGIEFIEPVDEAIEGIALNPAGYMKVVRESRRANLRQFIRPVSITSSFNQFWRKRSDSN